MLMQYDPLAGASTNDIEARLGELESDGIHRELAFPNAMLALMGWPDKAIRELLLPHLQRAHRRAAGAVERPLLRRRDGQLVGRRRVPPDARRDEGPRPQDVLAAAEARRRRRRQADRLQQPRRCTRCGRPSRRAASRWRTTSARRRWPRRAGTTASSSGWCTTSRRSARCSAATCSAGSSTATPASASAGSRAASTGSRRRSRTPSTSTPRCSTWPTTRSSTTSPTTGTTTCTRRSWSTRSGSR